MNETTTIDLPPPGGGGPTGIAEVPITSPEAAKVGSVLAVSDTMVVLTWLAFLIACFALYKVAWKPISEALDRREEKIRQSLKEAEDLKKWAVMDKEAQKEMHARAVQEAAEIVERARTTAEASARALEAQAKTEADALVRHVAVEIEQAKEKALEELRRETAGLALDLAGRVLEKKLDAAEDRELADRLMREV